MVRARFPRRVAPQVTHPAGRVSMPVLDDWYARRALTVACPSCESVQEARRRGFSRDGLRDILQCRQCGRRITVGDPPARRSA